MLPYLSRLLERRFILPSLPKTLFHDPFAFRPRTNSMNKCNLIHLILSRTRPITSLHYRERRGTAFKRGGTREATSIAPLPPLRHILLYPPSPVSLPCPSQSLLSHPFLILPFPSLPFPGIWGLRSQLLGSRGCTPENFFEKLHAIWCMLAAFWKGKNSILRQRYFNKFITFLVVY
jgi:hypothetical protein